MGAPLPAPPCLPSEALLDANSISRRRRKSPPTVRHEEPECQTPTRQYDERNARPSLDGACAQDDTANDTEPQQQESDGRPALSKKVAAAYKADHDPAKRKSRERTQRGEPSTRRTPFAVNHRDGHGAVLRGLPGAALQLTDRSSGWERASARFPPASCPCGRGSRPPGRGRSCRA